MRTPLSGHRRRAWLLLASTIAACASGDEPSPASAPASFAATSTTARCAPPATGTTVPPPAGALLPPGAVVTALTVDGPTTRADGAVPSSSPVELRRFYARSGWRILQIEDEIVEMEVLAADGRTRTFFKATTACGGGSTFVSVTAAEISP